MPLPKPNKNEKEEKFLDRCMGNPVMNKEFPQRERRFAVCKSLYKGSKTKKKANKSS